MNISLKDLTPGGWNYFDYPLGGPDIYIKFEFGDWAQHKYVTLFATAQQTDGFVGSSGELQGGVNFNTNLMNTSPTTIADVWWDFSNSPGFALTNLVLTDSGPFENFYKVPLAMQIVGHGTVTVNGISEIDRINFFGRTPTSVVADTGWSIVLFVLGLLVIKLFHDKKTTR